MNVFEERRQKGEVVVIGIDLGTSFSAVNWCNYDLFDGKIDVIPGKVPIDRLKTVFFGDGDDEQVRSSVAWHPGERRLMCGSDLDRAIKDRHLPESSRIDMVKLGLDDSVHTKDHRDRLVSRFELS